MTKWQKFIDFFGCSPVGAIGFDGASATAECKRCGAKILQDSQGGWFPVSEVFK